MSFRWRPTSSQIRRDRIIAVDATAPALAPVTEDKVKELAAGELPPLVFDGLDSGSDIPENTVVIDAGGA